MTCNLILLEADLRRDEGARSVPYRDTQGNWTNGVGHDQHVTHEGGRG